MWRLVASALVVTSFAASAEPSRKKLRAFPLDVHSFKVLERDSGPRNYYRTMSEDQDFIRGVYSPSLKTVTLFAAVPDELHRGVRSIRFRWRALVLPRGGDECKPDHGDAAANVYIAWKRGLRWYSVKLAWSTEAPLGATCN